MSIARLMQMARAGVPAGDVWTDPDLANASYDSVSFSVAGQDTVPASVVFNNTGSKMYVAGLSADTIYQYSLSSPFDVSTASYDSVSLSVSTEDTSPYSIRYNADGSKLYMIGLANDSIFQYSLSTSFDLSSASYDSISFSFATQDTNPGGFFFKPDGLKLFVLGFANDSVFEYSLSAAFDLTTISYSGNSFSVASQDSTPQDLVFNPDGTKMFVLGAASDAIYEYDLSSPWSISSAAYASVSFSVASQDSAPLGFTFKPDGSKMYVVGNTNDTIYQYST